MQQIYLKSSPLQSTVFSSVDSHHKWTTVPNFMLTANFQHHSKLFGMFPLERSWLNSNSVFRQLVNQISSFNKQLIEIKRTIEIPNYLKTYHLYKNLHEQLLTLNSIVSSLKQAKDQLDFIKKNFQKEKASLRQIKKPKILPGINNSFIDPEQEQNLRRTVRQIQNKRQFEVNTLMPRTYYAQNLPYKDRTFEYKQQLQSLDLSQTASVFTEIAHNESKILHVHPSLESMNSKSKSLSNLTSTAWTSQAKNYSNCLNKNNKIENSPKIKPFSQVFSSLKKPQTNQGSSKSIKDLRFTPKITVKFNKHSENILDKMINKDKIQNILNEPDSRLIKNLSAKDLQKPSEILNIKSSRVSYILSQEKNQLINRKQFISVESESDKFKKRTNRLRTDLNRKLEFNKYFSNHLIQKNTQISKDSKYSLLKAQVGKKIMSLPKKEINLSQNQNHSNELTHVNQLKIIPEQGLQDPIELKKKQFQQTLKKQPVKKSLSNYIKYINHLPEPNPQDTENNSHLGKTVSSNSSSYFETTRKSFISQSQKKFQSLNSFRSSSLQRNIGPSKELKIIKVINKHSIERNNQEILDDVVKIKLRMSESENPSNLNAVIKNKLLFKGLQLHHAPQDTEYQVIQPKLFSNPFFVAPKASKKTKKKRK